MMLDRTRGRRLVSRAVSLIMAGFMTGSLLLLPEPVAAQSRRGSIRHSGSRNRAGTNNRVSTPARSRRPATRRPATRARVARPPAARPPARAARAGYRAGYRAGHRNSWYDARRSYYRWRTVTGLFAMGMYFATRPRVSATVVVTGATYYYTGGFFYVSSAAGYTVVSAPPGAVVYAVPVHTAVVYAGTSPYYYSGGTYYIESDQPAERPAPPPEPETTTPSTEDSELDSLSEVPMTDDGSYEVVAPPAGATVPYLPDEADEETVEGKKYFVVEGTYYRAFASDDETVYMVVEDPHQV